MPKDKDIFVFGLESSDSSARPASSATKRRTSARNARSKHKTADFGLSKPDVDALSPNDPPALTSRSSPIEALSAPKFLGFSIESAMATLDIKDNNKKRNLSSASFAPETKEEARKRFLADISLVGPSC